MSKKRTIEQIPPNSKRPKAPGTYGWGFDIDGGFRVVMYAPKDWDEEIARDSAGLNGCNGADAEYDEKNFSHPKLATRQDERLHKRLKKIDDEHRHSRGEEHGPAHIHVIHKASSRESKFELVLHYDLGQSYVRPIPKNSKRTNGHQYTPLTTEEVDAVLPLLHPYCADFAKLWQEFYHETESKKLDKLSNYVTRVSEKLPGVERTHITNGDMPPEKWVEIEFADKTKRRIPFDDYVKTPPPSRQ